MTRRSTARHGCSSQRQRRGGGHGGIGEGEWKLARDMVARISVETVIRESVVMSCGIGGLVIVADKSGGNGELVMYHMAREVRANVEHGPRASAVASRTGTGDEECRTNT